VRRLGIVMNGVTGAWDNQHLVRSIVASGRGASLEQRRRVMPIHLVGATREAQPLAKQRITRVTTDLDRAGRHNTVFFDAAPPDAPALLGKHRAGKHIYCEKPVATT